MRGAVGAEEDARRAAGDRLQQCGALRLGLEHRQTVQVRANTPGEQGVAVQQQVLWRHGGRHSGAGAAHEMHRRVRGDVLEHQAQTRGAR
jgi:hypothetical protein